MTPPLLPEPPIAADAQVLFSTADIMLDSSVVLNLYRMTAATRGSWFEVLERVQNRLVMPHQVALEVSRRATSSRTELPDAYTALGQQLQTMRSAPAAQFSGARHLQAERIGQLKAIIERHLEPMLRELDEAREHDEAVLSADRDIVMARLDQVFAGRVLPEPAQATIRRRVTRFTEYRGPNEVPPGWRDHGKKKPRDAAGDYLLWAEMLEHARTSGRPFIVVTDDTKDDWWVKHDGLTPAPEMLAEAVRATGRPHAQMTSQDFLSLAQRLLSLGENEAAVEETAEVASAPDDVEDSDALRILREIARDSSPEAEVEVAGLLSRVGPPDLAQTPAGAAVIGLILAAAWERAARSQTSRGVEPDEG